MSDAVTVRARKVMRNALLARRQMVVDVSHPGKPAQAKKDVVALLAKLYTVEANLCVVYGFKTAFGGGSSSGFALIYDDEDALKKFEPKHRLIAAGLDKKKTRSRKQWKDAKRKSKRTWGTGRADAVRAAKKAAAS